MNVGAGANATNPDNSRSLIARGRNESPPESTENLRSAADPRSVSAGQVLQPPRDTSIIWCLALEVVEVVVMSTCPPGHVPTENSSEKLVFGKKCMKSVKWFECQKRA